jgi:hypothetical protein
MQFILLGLAFTGLGIWEIYRGRSSFFLVGRWWTWLHFDRDKHPSMFWFCISLDFLAALICFGAAILSGVVTLLDS